jgi:hypothetical protein
MANAHNKKRKNISLETPEPPQIMWPNSTQERERKKAPATTKKASKKKKN